VNISAGFDAGIDPLVAGTSINLSGTPGSPNRGTGFYRIGTIYDAGAFRMDGFNFTGLTDVSISFAYNSQDIFTWDTNLEVDYRINGGSWVDIDELETWTLGYVLADISFGNALDGQNNVDLRIRTDSWLSTFGYLDIDNVQVKAVPEPSTILLLSLGLVSLSASRRRRRSSSR